MPNPDIGEISCPCCGGVVPVRKSVKGKLYFVCNVCGLFPMAYPGGQEWVLEHATIYGSNDRPAPAADTDPERKPEPAPEPAPPAPKDPGDDKRPEPAGGLEDWLP